MQKTKRPLWLTAALAAFLVAVAVAGCKHDEEDEWTPLTIRGTVLEKYAGQRKSVTIPDGVTGIGSRAFSGSDVAEVVIPPFVTSIAPDAFADSNVTSVSYIGSQEKWNELVGNGLPDGIQVACFIIENDILIRYEGDETEVVIPAGFVKGIAGGVFRDCAVRTGITGVTIPGSVKRIGENAFADCTALADVRIEAGVADIGAGAFAGCTALESLNIPAGVTTLGERMVNGCDHLTELVVHESVTTIAADAFSGIGRKEITYRAKKAKWEKLVADNGIRQNLAGFTVHCTDGDWNGPEQGEDNPPHTHDWDRYEIIDNDNHKAICTVCGHSKSEAHVYGDEGDGECNLCGYQKENPGDPTCEHVFDYKEIDDVYHTKTCTKNCGASSTETHNYGTVTYQDDGHHQTCTVCNHTKIESHDYVGAAFKDDSKGGHYQTCTATDCNVHNEPKAHEPKYEKIDDDTHRKRCIVCTYYSESMLHEWSDKYTGINDSTHTKTCKDCNHPVTENHHYDNDADTVCNGCGYKRPLPPGDLKIEGGTLTIGDNGEVTGYVTDYSTPSVDIPAGATGVGNGAFYGNSYIQNVSIPDTVTSIGTAAFAGCGSLTAMDIPTGVTSIGEGAFQGCNSLSTVIIPNTVTSIGESAFYGCGTLSSVEIPYGVTSIGKETFSRCGSLSTVIIPNSVKSIGEEAFFWCNSLSNVTIPFGVTEIGENAFCGTTALLSIVIPDSVTTIGEGAFQNSGIQHVTIPANVNAIGSGAFTNCPTFMDITFKGTRAQWEALTNGVDIGIVEGMTVTCSDGTITTP